MTTIAYRAGILAADSLITGDGCQRVGTANKVRQSDDGYLFSFCGLGRYAEAFFAWGETAESRAGEPPTFNGDDSTGIMITPNGGVREWFGSGWCEVQAEFRAWGIGEKLALGAMAMGADAETAVGIAIQFDINSGGPTVVVKLEEAEFAEVEGDPFGEVSEFFGKPPADAPEPNSLDGAKERLGL